ncbi:hypothetical protein KGV55_02670 [Candidatus Gracilibacteria bacterium]|nr:hypothetical protein [Candidatus Gracilibacteria bacterium]
MNKKLKIISFIGTFAFLSVGLYMVSFSQNGADIELKPFYNFIPDKNIDVKEYKYKMTKGYQIGGEDYEWYGPKKRPPVGQRNINVSYSTDANQVLKNFSTGSIFCSWCPPDKCKTTNPNLDDHDYEEIEDSGLIK